MILQDYDHKTFATFVNCTKFAHFHAVSFGISNASIVGTMAKELLKSMLKDAVGLSLDTPSKSALIASTRFNDE